jgi:alkylhydroperoxidase/carboxymuconolactone decarboxylase family protein YurZ
VEEILHLGASDAEIAETLDIGAIMGGTISMKSVRHAFAVMDDIKKGQAP